MRWKQSRRIDWHLECGMYDSITHVKSVLLLYLKEAAESEAPCVWLQPSSVFNQGRLPEDIQPARTQCKHHLHLQCFCSSFPSTHGFHEHAYWINNWPRTLLFQRKQSIKKSHTFVANPQTADDIWAARNTAPKWNLGEMWKSFPDGVVTG